MLKFKFFILSLATILISCIGLSSCEKEDPLSPTNPYAKTTGEYKVELTFSGDIDGFKPVLYVDGEWPLSDFDNYIYDVKTDTILNPTAPIEKGVYYNYEQRPQVFSSPIIIRTNKKAFGMKVFLQSFNSLENKKITIHAKGYFKNKLIKEETKEVTNAQSTSIYGGFDWTFKFGDPIAIM